MKFKIVEKKILSDSDLNMMFEILKPNLIKLGYTNISDSEKEIWKSNHNQSNNFYFWIYADDNFVGYFELCVNENKLFLSEIQLCGNVKQTKTILYVIKFLTELDYFKDFDKIYFSINKTNSLSNKTFSHLGGKIVRETEKKNIYELSRDKIEQYLSKYGRI